MKDLISRTIALVLLAGSPAGAQIVKVDHPPAQEAKQSATPPAEDAASASRSDTRGTTSFSPSFSERRIALGSTRAIRSRLLYSTR